MVFLPYLPSPISYAVPHGVPLKVVILAGGMGTRHCFLPHVILNEVKNLSP